LGVKRMIANLIEPKLDWRTLLDAHIRSQMKDDYTFQRLSRRTWGTGAIMPAQNFIERVECWGAIDASGSTTDEMVTAFLSEMKGIMESFQDFRIGILCFDTEVYNVYEFTPENFDDVYSYTIRGGGGTMFEAIFEFFKSQDIEPNRLAIFTDGLPNAGWGDPDYCDTIFIIHSNPQITAPFGLTAHYEDADPLAKAA
jgi:predicted metal-dependent peptidase